MNCNYCGRENPQLIFTVFNDNAPTAMCPNCAQVIGTCGLCTNSVKCEFESNPSPLPKMVMKTVQQGNMIMQTTIPNPDRIKALCPSCACYSEDPFICCRHVAGTCKNYTEWTPPSSVN